MIAEQQPLFSLGRVVATPGALQALAAAGQSPTEFLDRHVRGQWGELCEGDQKANDQALLDGTRILSAYKTDQGIRIWVITEANRSSTCILLPDEY